MFESKTLRLLQAENAAMRAQVSDMHERHLQIYKEWAIERKQLLDRILALSQPLALREVNRGAGPTDTTAVPQKTKVESSQMVERNWPRPMVPNRPSISPQEKDKQMGLSDIEAAADFERKQG